MADQAESTAATAETTPLLTPATDSARMKPPRSVTFNANPVTRTIDPLPIRSSRQTRSPQSRYGSGSYPAFSSGTAPAPPVLAALNNRLRRRNSQGSIPNAIAVGAAGVPTGLSKIGPQRSSKTAQKLKLLPEPDPWNEVDEESGRDVYSQFTRIKDPTARRDAARLGKADRENLPRVTAYCTADRYGLEPLMRYLKGRGKKRSANPKLIDECIYTPYNYNKPETRQDSGLGLGLQGDPVQNYERRHSADLGAVSRGYEPDGSIPAVAVEDATGEYGSMDVPHNHLQSGPEPHSTSLIAANDFDTQVHTPEIFLFDYGVVVIWGMSVSDEQRLLKDLSRFEIERLPADLIETEEFNFYYTREYQPRIYNDFISLRDKHNYMTKLAISHALAQSVKTSLFEELITTTIETCKEIPNEIAVAGKLSLTRSEINMQIGELFTLRINIHLNGSVLDTPEVFWVEPQLEPVYQAVRSYLEMDQRVGLLNDRLDVIADLLAVLKDLLSHRHGEKLEWIGWAPAVIILIAAEIFVAVINIVIDVYAGI
ncbi:hypothetical protein jhhlp_002091 [Lomentospora prolificans]|uniref:DUF155 domain-containing protein n=1 Tax=Lomentospora prolificans TaxID=41688 RepID=A0A2N3ND22_9PEZI|nr:hypothetical protein jhhlp_002091 [Lomentospora prolificans]